MSDWGKAVEHAAGLISDEGWSTEDLERAYAESLDAAWTECEAALPRGWNLYLALEAGEYKATAESDDPEEVWLGARASDDGLTPAAALRQLAAKLKEQS